MKPIHLGTLLAVLACTGCWHLPQQQPAEKTPLPPPAARKPVTPEQVTPATAHKVVESLWQEMDREQP